MKKNGNRCSLALFFHSSLLPLEYAKLVLNVKRKENKKWPEKRSGRVKNWNLLEIDEGTDRKCLPPPPSPPWEFFFVSYARTRVSKVSILPTIVTTVPVQYRVVWDYTHCNTIFSTSTLLIGHTFDDCHLRSIGDDYPKERKGASRSVVLSHAHPNASLLWPVQPPKPSLLLSQGISRVEPEEQGHLSD